MGDVELTDQERAALREFRHTAEHPAYAANGARAADHLRKLYPSLADIEMAAILCQVTGWAARHGARCDCNHLFAFTAGEFPVLVDSILIAVVLLGLAVRCAWRAARALKQHRWAPEVQAAIDAEDSAIDHARTVLQGNR